MKFFPQHIRDLENQLEDVRELKNKVVKKQKYEEAAKLRDDERRLEKELNKAIEAWEKESDEHGIHNVNRICLRIRNGKIEVLFEQKSGGTFVYSDGSLELDNELFLLTQSKWKNVIKQLEELINKSDLKEQELQDFFEEYPDLVMEDDYSEIIPQATIVSEEGIKWKADFVLKPRDQTNFCKVIELKLPKEKTFNETRSGHRKYTAKLMAAVNQLKDYSEAFNYKKTRQIFKEKYGTEIFKPDLQLMFGRKPPEEMTRDFLEMKRRTNVDVDDWDSIVEKLKRKFK